jgi:outer membrane protein, multidrug efflux system
VGPDYHAPKSKVSPAFNNTPATVTSQVETVENLATFWKAFHDVMLDQLVERALKSNTSIRVAQANLQAVRADQRGILAEFWPTLSTHASAKNAVTSDVIAGGSRAARTHTTYEGTLDMDWEISFFGRFARGREMAAAQVSAEEAGLQAVQVSVVAEVVNHYLGYRGLQAQQQFVQERVQKLQKLLEVAQARYRLGRSSALEVAQVQELLENARVALPEFQSALQQAKDRLALLTGQMPNSLDESLRELRPLPASPMLKMRVSPAQLLERRPDIRQAERQLAAATALQGVRTADFFPNVSLTGLLGLNAGVLGALSEGNSIIHSLGASLGWTLLDFGRLRSRLDHSKAGVDAALAHYEGTVLAAFQETEAALLNFNQRATQTEHHFAALKAAQEVSRIAKARFEAGATDISQLLQAEDQRLQEHAALTSAQTAQAAAFVAVYKALGGGFMTSLDQAKN